MDTSTFTKLDDERYVWIDEYSDENMSYINSDKSIKVDENQINLTQEENSQYVPFEMNRYYDGVDLLDKMIVFHFVNANGNDDYSSPINVQYNEISIRFGWLINQSVTAIVGEIKFEIVATGTNSNGQNYVWRSKPDGTFNILESLSGNGIIQPSTDWYVVFVNSMNSKIKEASDYASKAILHAESAEVSAQSASEKLEETKKIAEESIEKIQNSIFSFASFGIDDDGNLTIDVNDSYSNITFSTSEDGELEVNY